jgi:hypothetical protein
VPQSSLTEAADAADGPEVCWETVPQTAPFCPEHDGYSGAEPSVKRHGGAGRVGAGHVPEDTAEDRRFGYQLTFQPVDTESLAPACSCPGKGCVVRESSGDVPLEDSAGVEAVGGEEAAPYVHSCSPARKSWATPTQQT